MAVKNLSVDDILNEIKIKNAKASNAPAGSMEHVDEMIQNILMERQEAALKKEKRELTLREKKALEEEVRVQTKTLTAQLEKLQKEQKLPSTVSTPPEQGVPAFEKRMETAELKITPVKKEQKVKFRDTAEMSLPKEQKEKKEQKYQELKKLANTQHLRQDMDDIASHFGNVKMTDKGADDNVGKTEITPHNYKEYKTNRNKRVDGFVLEKNKPVPPPVEEVPENMLEQEQPLEPEKTAFVETDLPDELVIVDYEYTEPSKMAEVAENLNATKKSAVISAVALGVLSLLSLIFLFMKPQESNFLFAGTFPLAPGIYAFLNLGVLLAAVIASFSIFTNAVQSLAEHKPDKDMLYLLTAVVCAAVNIVFCLQPEALFHKGVVLYTPVLVIALFFDFLAKTLSIKRIIKNFGFISNDEPKYAALPVLDSKVASNMTKGLVDGEPALMKNVSTGFFQNFLSHSFRHDHSDVLAGRIAIAAIPAALVMFLLCYFITKDFYAGLCTAGATMLMLTGFISAMVVAVPLYDTAAVVNHFSGMMPEYDAIETHQDTNAVMMDACGLFPPESVVLHGIKTFQGKRIDNAIVDAASILASANSVLKSVFLSIIANKEELLKPVDSILYEDLMGISAWVDEKRVLIGNRELMINHSIAVPKKDYERKYTEEGHEVVYLSTEGELCAAFIVGFSAARSATDVVNLLYKNEIVAVVKSVDSCITGDLLERVFGVEQTQFKLLPSRLHREFDAEIEPVEQADSTLGNNGSLFGFAVSIVACKKLAGCMRLGGVMYLISAICGVVLLGATLLLGRVGMIGNLQMLIFMGLFALVYWLYEKNMKM